MWELNYSSPDFELIDVTIKLLELLKAPEKFIKMHDEFMKQRPVEDAFFIED
jgi:hypothetical protein